MRRREFITLVGIAAVCPRAVGAQQPATPLVGILNAVTFEPYARRVAAIRQGLAENGFVEGQNVSIEYRGADGHYERLPGLAAELIRLRAGVIIAIGSSMAARAAKAATTEVPIVFMIGADPVAAGLVASLSRPAGNLTGVTNFAVELATKRLELLHEIKPDAQTIGYMINVGNLVSEMDAKRVVEAGHAIGRDVLVFRVRTDQDIDGAMTTAGQRALPMVLQGEAFLTSRREQIVKLAERHAIPVMHATRESVVTGGLASYAPDIVAMNRMAGVFAGRILKGAKPADLPVQQPTKYELVLNLKTAKALGLQIPAAILARADEVVE